MQTLMVVLSMTGLGSGPMELALRKCWAAAMDQPTLGVVLTEALDSVPPSCSIAIRHCNNQTLLFYLYNRGHTQRVSEQQTTRFYKQRHTHGLKLMTLGTYN